MGKKKSKSLFNVTMSIRPNVEGPEIRVNRTIDFKKAGIEGLRTGLFAAAVNVAAQAFLKK